MDVLRRKLAEEYQVSVAGDGELQGPLIQKLSQELEDPDTEVTRWILDKSTPLGIPSPIVPCGVFPKVDPWQASDETDHWATPWNYTSFDEYREGAEQLLRGELEFGWLD